METKIDFTMTNNDYIYNITSNVILHINEIGKFVALLYFTDEVSNKINIPDGIVVYSYDYENSKNKVLLNAINQDYALCWTHDYTVELNKYVVININNQRKWNIIL